MAGNDDFVSPLPIQFDQPARLALVWAGRDGWTDTNLSIQDTKPGDSSLNIGLSDKTRAMTMPLAPEQALQFAVEILIRLDIIKPLVQGVTS